MSHTPHELADDFPQDIEKIHELKVSDPHFAKLMEDYHEMNRAVHRAETGVEPCDQLAENNDAQGAYAPEGRDRGHARERPERRIGGVRGRCPPAFGLPPPYFWKDGGRGSVSAPAPRALGVRVAFQGRNGALVTVGALADAAGNSDRFEGALRWSRSSPSA
jgi:uncharacterized protein YdcH (DUF465 family)